MCCDPGPEVPKPNLCAQQSRIIPLKQIEYGFGDIVGRSPYTPYSIYSRQTICCHYGDSYLMTHDYSYCCSEILACTRGTPRNDSYKQDVLSECSMSHETRSPNASAPCRGAMRKPAFMGLTSSLWLRIEKKIETAANGETHGDGNGN